MLGGWTLFTLENVILSENRDAIKRAWGGRGGMGAYQNMYSMLSAACLGSTTLAYARFADSGLVLSSAAKPARVRLAALLLRGFGLVTMGQLLPPINLDAAPIALGLKTPSKDLPPAVRGAMGCPFDFNAHREQGEVFGITRMSRRPELVGLAAVGVGGALLAKTATQICYWGIGPSVCFGILALHSDRTQRRSGDLSPFKEEQTSVAPFLAMLDGRQSFGTLCDELVLPNAGAGVLLAMLAALRPSWFRWVRKAA